MPRREPSAEWAVRQDASHVEKEQGNPRPAEDCVARPLRGRGHGPRAEAPILIPLDAVRPDLAPPVGRPDHIVCLAEALPQPAAHLIPVRRNMTVVGPEDELLAGIFFIGKPFYVPRHRPI